MIYSVKFPEDSSKDTGESLEKSKVDKDRPAPIVRKDFKDIYEDQKSLAENRKKLREKGNETEEEFIDVNTLAESEASVEEKPNAFTLFSAANNKSKTSKSKNGISSSDEGLQKSKPFEALAGSKDKNNSSQQEEGREESLKMSKKNLTGVVDTKKNSRTLKKEADGDTLSSLPKEEEYNNKKENKISTLYSSQHTELSTVNPLSAGSSNIHAIENSIAAKAEAEHTTPVWQIVDKIVEEMYTLEKSGQTDTVITLKHPPIFEGAQIVVTSFDSAKKEFNLAFENLTNNAKNLLDTNLAALTRDLHEKGYVTHIVTTSTSSEHIAVKTDESRQDRGQEDREGQQQQKQKQKNKEDQA